MAGNQRQEHLREYLLACVRDSVLAPSDLASPDILNKLLRVISSDVRTVLKDLGKEAGSRLLLGVANMLMKMT